MFLKEIIVDSLTLIFTFSVYRQTTIIDSQITNTYCSPDHNFESKFTYNLRTIANNYTIDFNFNLQSAKPL